MRMNHSAWVEREAKLYAMRKALEEAVECEREKNFEQAEAWVAVAANKLAQAIARDKVIPITWEQS